MWTGSYTLSYLMMFTVFMIKTCIMTMIVANIVYNHTASPLLLLLYIPGSELSIVKPNNLHDMQ